MELINWDLVRLKTESEKWALTLYQNMKKELDAFIDVYQDDSKRIAGWFHHYNCERCQGRLIFNWENKDEHLCSVCGTVNTGELFTKVWNNMYRGKANQNVYNAVVAYKLSKDDKYILYIKKVLDFYTDKYDEFICEPPAKIFEGKLLNQHLDDAVGMMTVILGMNMVRECFTEAELFRYYTGMFAHEAELFDFFANRIYNIPLWIKCAQTMIGIFFNKQEHIQKGLYSRYGVLDQLKRGVTEEGMWYEASMHYHFYSTQPLCYLLYIAKSCDFDFNESQYMYDKVEKMLEYPLKMMFQNRRLPNPNDAHPVITIDNYKLHYEYGSVIFNNKLFRDICGGFYENDSDSGDFTRLLFNNWQKPDKPIRFGSINNPQSFSAMLRNQNIELFLTYGGLTGLHRHPAVMNMEISFNNDVVSFDIGNGGYASELFSEWQRKSIAHNTVLIDKENQKRLPEGDVLEYNENKPSIKVKAKAVYSAVDYTRSFEIIENTVYDNFEVEGRGEYLMDWFFYCKGDILCPYETTTVDKIGDADGYQYLFDIRTFESDDDWYVEFDMEDKKAVLTMKGEKGTRVFIVNSYTSNKESTRYGVVVRRKNEKTVYGAKYTFFMK